MILEMLRSRQSVISCSLNNFNASSGKGFGRLAFEAPSNSTDMISIVLFNTNGALRAMEIESCQALNLAKAAAATPTLEHYIWSTLPDAKTQSSGKVLVPHFESKNIANRFILSQPEILAKTMFAILGYYTANFYWQKHRPIFIPTAKFS